ncbi:MAG: hypothetical protein J7L34_04380 [Thermotogaceae bacterium]|nr:hypothetical protein [Thermotogaceae bacterium]
MFDDVKKILEAVANKEITQEEAELLIKALKEKEDSSRSKNKKEKEKEKKKKENVFTLEEDQFTDDDLVLISERAVIRGKIAGDLALIECETVFSGDVAGDMVIIGGKVLFEGGRVAGDLVSIGASVSGDEPEVLGSRVTIGNFLVRGILAALSPLFRGIRIAPKMFSLKGEDLQKWGRDVFHGDSFHVPHGVKEKMIGVSVDIAAVDGELDVVFIKADVLTVTGKLIAKNIKADKIRVKQGGIVEAHKINTEVLENFGEVRVKELSAEKVFGNAIEEGKSDA